MSERPDDSRPTPDRACNSPRGPDANALAPGALPRVTPAGDSALLVTMATTIGEEARARVATLDAALASAAIAGIIETVPAYTSLLVVFDPCTTGYEDLMARLAPLATAAFTRAGSPRRGRHWRIPVCYGGGFGIDLEHLAERVACAPDTVIAAHSGATYVVHMLGFLPGFAYLAGLPDRLAAPRRATPRQCVPVGSVAIGGAQTAMWPIAGPCGWHLIGRTPCRTFERVPEPGSFLASGDLISFEPVEPRFFAALELAAERGARIAEVIA